MSADKLLELINEFCSKGEITASEMNLLQFQAKELELSEQELKLLIDDVINEQRSRKEKIKLEQELEQKRKKESEIQKKQLELERNKRNKVLIKKIKTISTIILITVVIIIIVIFTVKYFKQKGFWNDAKQINTYSSYQDYLNKYPEGSYISEAKTLQEDALWKQAQNENTVQSYDNYLSTYTNGRYKSESLTKKECAFWNDVKTNNKVEGFESYINTYPNGKYINLIWDIVSPLILEPKKLGVPGYLTLFNVIERLHLSSKIIESDKYQLALALSNYENGDRERAISIFKKFSIQNPTSEEGKISSEIISPPKTGRIDYNFSARQFKGTRNNWGGENGLMIKLMSTEIESTSITLTFVIENLKVKDLLLYAPKYREELFAKPIQTLQIQDNNGKIFNSISGFIGGRQNNFNDDIKQVEFNPSEKATLKVKFPMISEGATTIKFISPSYNGWQYEWWWENINLKVGPFE